MSSRDDAIFVDHNSKLVYTPRKRELIWMGVFFAVLVLAALITRETFLTCLGIYTGAILIASLGLNWILHQAANRYEAAIPPTPQLIMALGGYLSAVALPIGAISNIASHEAILNAGPMPDFADDLVTFGAVAAVLLPMGDILFRIWAIKTAKKRRLETSASEEAWEQVANLERLAYQDPLTGLPNRRCFEESLAQLGSADQEFAVIFFDFDKFKPINDLHGHAVGDEFLRAIAQRIRSLVRSSDLVARLGGDEFAVLIKGNDAKSASSYLADRFTQAMREPVICTGVELASSASIGVAVGRSGLDTVEHVVHQADMAMYEAKRSGGARYCVAS